MCSGRLAEGLALVDRGIKAYEMAGRRDGTGHVAEAYLVAGRLEEAAAYARQTLPQARARGERRLEATALCLLGGVSARRDPPDLPRSPASYYLEALTLAGQFGMCPLVAPCHRGLGELARVRGDGGRAREHLATAVTMYREMDMRFWLERAEAEMRALEASMAR